MQTKESRTDYLRLSRILIALGVLCVLSAGILYAVNVHRDRSAAAASTDIVSHIQSHLPDAPIPTDTMPQRDINGNTYAGYLTIPALDVELPVMAQWSYPKLKIAPCRYHGWTTTHDFVIAAHNYKSHFGRLSILSIGDDVVFTDLYGNVTNYQIADFEILQPGDIDLMINSDWDLTLYTCTYGGAKRVTVRCRQID